jgi:predicted lipid-binding transport protein (Tim44 family)
MWGALRPGAKALLAALALGVLFLALWYLLSAGTGRVSEYRQERRDAQREQNVNAAVSEGAAREQNANTTAAERQEQERQLEAQRARQRAAAANSNATLEPLHDSRRRYEKIRRSRPDFGGPELSDEQLCTELAQRNIQCR